MLRLFAFSLVVALLSALSLAWTVPILGLGADPPPEALLTTDISPECVNVNNGTYLCCSSAVQGGDPIVVALADAAGYQLPANTVNGIECKTLACLFWFWFFGALSPVEVANQPALATIGSTDFSSCDADQGTDLCCQVITLVSPCSVSLPRRHHR